MMGAANVARVYVVWRALPDQDVRLLAFMANTALDAATDQRPARMYFGGRDHLALGLGRDVVGADAKSKTAAYEAVRRTIARLVKAGAVTRTTHAQMGTRQEYFLQLDDSNRGTRHVPQEGHTARAPQGHTPRGVEGHTPRGNRGTPDVPPRSTEEPREELLQEPIGSDLLQGDPSAHDPEGAGRKFREKLRLAAKRPSGRSRNDIDWAGAMNRAVARESMDAS